MLEAKPRVAGSIPAGRTNHKESQWLDFTDTNDGWLRVTLCLYGGPMRLICLSDTHNQHEHLTGWLVQNQKEGDVLVHAGDLTTYGSRMEVEEATTWLASLPYQTKLLVWGNHDEFGSSPQFTMPAGITLLQDSGVEIQGIKIWGSPWVPRLLRSHTGRDKDALRQAWGLIPSDTEVLITHGPPYGILDQMDWFTGNSFVERRMGCEYLARMLRDQCPALRVHVFGHMHENHGCHEGHRITHYNVAILDDNHQRGRLPTIIPLDPKSCDTSR